MEERNRIIDFFYKQLEILKSEHVEDLMKARRSKELERILKKKVIFSPVQEFIKKNESLGLAKDEIRKDLSYEMALYICCSDLADEHFRVILFRKNEKLATQIGKMMMSINLCDLSIKKLIEIPNKKN